MDDLGKLGTFSINSNLALLQDLYDMNTYVGQIIAGLSKSDDVPVEVWEILRRMQAKVDKTTKQCIVFPSHVHKIASETHVPETAEARN